MDFIRQKLLHASRIPADLDTVTQIDADREVPPEEVGVDPKDVESIWNNFRAVYKTGVHPAMSLCIRRHGKVLISRGIGHIRGNGPNDPADAEKVPVTADSPFCIYSSSKGVTAVLMHMLAEDGLIDIMDPVSFYCPDFSGKGKDNITIHHILSHRGGVPGLPADFVKEDMWNKEKIWELMCQARPITTDGSKLAYHAITGGFVLEKVVEKVTGEDINAYVDRKVRQPMGMQYFTYGIQPQHMDKLAVTYVTGPYPGPLVDAFAKRALGIRLNEVEEATNDPRFQEQTIPAGNLASSASEMSAFYQMLLNGGVWNGQRICAERTVARAIQPYGERMFDRTLMLPMRYSAGQMLGDSPIGMYGPNCEHAFGHLGLINKWCWADPERDISVSLLTSGIPSVSHHLLALMKTLGAIGNGIPRDGQLNRFSMATVA